MEEAKIDLVKDWQDQLIVDMKNEGIKADSTLEIKSKIIKYLTFLRKNTSGSKYKIHISKEFSCPIEYEDALNKIMKIIENGENIIPYFSKSTLKLENDFMFNCWGIIHLHLGNKPDTKNNRYIKRTGPLLFVYLCESEAYLIKIWEHGVWTELEILQIIENNWPELIGKLKGIDGLNQEFSSADRYKLWRNGGDTVTELKNKEGESVIIAPPGGGITASGDAVKDVIAYLHQVTKLKNREKEIMCNIEFIKAHLKDQNIDVPNGLEFKLLKDDDGWYIVEKNSNALIETKNKLNNRV